MEASPNLEGGVVMIHASWELQPNPVYVGRDYAIHHGVPSTCPLDIVDTKRGAILGYRTTDNYVVPLESQQEFLRGQCVRLSAVPILVSGNDATLELNDIPAYGAVREQVLVG